MKKYLITMLSTLTVTIGILFSFDLINENKDNELKKLENKIINFQVKTGAQDKVFGKISTKQIADELRKLGYQIDKKCIKLDYDLSSLGVSEVEIILHKKVSFKIKANLIK